MSRKAADVIRMPPIIIKTGSQPKSQPTQTIRKFKAITTTISNTDEVERAATLRAIACFRVILLAKTTPKANKANEITIKPIPKALNKSGLVNSAGWRLIDTLSEESLDLNTPEYQAMRIKESAVEPTVPTIAPVLTLPVFLGT